MAPGWAGFYIGVNGGYAFSDSHPVINTYPSNPPTMPGSIQPEGGFGGGQIGYNFQRGHFVYGVEIDFQGAEISDTSAGIPTGHPEHDLLKVDTNYFGTVRGRLGYDFGRMLVYATGGFAYGHLSIDESFNLVTPGSPINTYNGAYHTSSIETGYAVGGGVEYAMSPKWSLKAEYQYIDLGTFNTSLPISRQSGGYTFIESTKVYDDFSTVRAGLNYHIGAGYEALK